jgi:hypothetical protein
MDTLNYDKSYRFPLPYTVGCLLAGEKRREESNLSLFLERVYDYHLNPVLRWQTLLSQGIAG